MSVDMSVSLVCRSCFHSHDTHSAFHSQWCNLQAALGCWRDKMVSFGVPTLGVRDKANWGVRWAHITTRNEISQNRPDPAINTERDESSQSHHTVSTTLLPSGINGCWLTCILFRVYFRRQTDFFDATIRIPLWEYMFWLQSNYFTLFVLVKVPVSSTVLHIGTLTAKMHCLSY